MKPPPPEMEAQMSAEGWIEWRGGACPIDPHVEIEYRLRWFAEDAEPYRCKAGYCRWDHGRSPESAVPDHPNRRSDIIAYRILAHPTPGDSQWK